MTSKYISIDPTCYIDKTATIIGNVTIGKDCGVFPQAVIRGDENSIKIQDGTNIQDCCIIHVDENHPVSIGKHVSLGHGSIVHGAKIEDCCIIGMKATILNGAIVKKGSIIGAHALVTSNMIVPENSLVLGIPGKVKNQDLSYKEQAIENAETYIQLTHNYKNNKYTRYNHE